MLTEWWLKGTCAECGALEGGDKFDFCHLRPPTTTENDEYYPCIKDKVIEWCIDGRRLQEEVRQFKAKAGMDEKVREQFKKQEDTIRGKS